MIKLRVARISAVVEPSTATSATTELAGSLDGAALGAFLAAYHGHACRRGCFCEHGGVRVTAEHALLHAQKTNTVE